MMRNNRIFQSLGITSLGMMVRNSNRMQQGSAITDGDSASTVTQQGSSSEYSPDDEVIEEDEVDDSVVEKEDKVLTAPTMDKCRKGKGLENLTKELGSKIISQVAEGKKRQEKPAQAAKLASQGGVTARHHLPILPHFKEYKANRHHIDNFIGKVVINFDMDTRSDVVKYACTDILKSAMKNRRHHLKKKHFDNVPTNLVSVRSPKKNVSDEEWQRLVKMWSTTRHKETCHSNKDNRSKVKFHQKDGSRPYISHVHGLKEARKGEELTAIDLFKECHNGKKAGFSEPAHIESAMEQEVPESEEPKSVVVVVADILTKECPSSIFLQNVGLESTPKKKFNRSASALDAHVQELEYKLEKERQSVELVREELVEVKKKSEEADVARAMEYHLLLKKVKDADARAKASDARFARLMDLFEGKIA
ncbi:hypothetical protein D1007_38241 [Hordeum vulgare]|nr:hypothetical protein D1007_38241 [Hordeum vulgare]